MSTRRPRDAKRFGFIVKRLLMLIPLVLGILLVTTFLLDLTPGDPARLVAGPRASAQDVAKVRDDLGLNRPFIVRYVMYVANVFHGDFGVSFKTGQNVSQQIAQQLPVTLGIAVGAIVLSLLISVPLAIVAAKHADGPIDQGIRVFDVLCIGLPSFWIAVMLITYVALPSGIFPVAGLGNTMGDHVLALVMPILTVTIGLIPPMVRSLRAALLEVYGSDYFIAAKTLGFHGGELTRWFVLRNASGPLVTVAASQAGFALFGTTVVEVAFALPGIGQGMVTAASSRDFPLIQGYTFTFAIIVIAIYLVADIISAAIDPRVRIES